MNDKRQIMVLRGIIKNEEGKYLLLQRSLKSKGWPGFWEFPGGKADAGEKPAAAFIREMKEETGLSVTPGAVVDEFVWERDFDTINYRILLADDVSGKLVLSDEHDASQWLSIDEIEKIKLSPPLKRVVERLKDLPCVL